MFRPNCFSTFVSRINPNRIRNCPILSPSISSNANFSTASSPLPTVIHDIHLHLNGKMTDFAGYDLPIVYQGEEGLGLIESCKWTRTNASLFDVSHMVSIVWSGKDCCEFVEKITTAALKESESDSDSRLQLHKSTLSLICNEEGGIIDDTMLTMINGEDVKRFQIQIGESNVGDSESESRAIYQVINAGCAEKDIKHFETELQKFRGLNSSKDVKMTVFNGGQRGLFALQGPKAEEALLKYSNDKAAIQNSTFGDSFWIKWGGSESDSESNSEIFATRTGYTGEDGFELFCPTPKIAQKVWKNLTQTTDNIVKPAGLGARDCLRLEAGLCLYGHDLTEEITPVEASLSWTIAKSRRNSTGDLLDLSKKSRSNKRRVGFIVEGKVPAREGMEIFKKTESDKKPDLSTESSIGYITSGRTSVCMNDGDPNGQKHIAMGYVEKPYNKVGSRVLVKIRSKVVEAEVVKMPFIENRYKK